MQRKINTLMRALTTLTHKIVDSGSKRRGGGYRGGGGYATDEDVNSDKENDYTKNRGRRQNKKRTRDDVKPNGRTSKILTEEIGRTHQR